MRRLIVLGVYFLQSILCLAQESAQRDYTKLAAEGDVTAHNFRFHSGETLSNLRLHYVTWGTLKKNEQVKSQMQCCSSMERAEEVLVSEIHTLRCQVRTRSWDRAERWILLSIS